PDIDTLSLHDALPISGGLREQPGVPGIPLQRRRDRPGSSMSAPNYSLWQMVQYMAKLGTIGFGGPVALVGYMHRDLVEQRKWISDRKSTRLNSSHLGI